MGNITQSAYPEIPEDIASGSDTAQGGQSSVNTRSSGRGSSNPSTGTRMSRRLATMNVDETPPARLALVVVAVVLAVVVARARAVLVMVVAALLVVLSTALTVLWTTSIPIEEVHSMISDVNLSGEDAGDQPSEADD